MSQPPDLSVDAFATRYKSESTRYLHRRNLGTYLTWLEAEGISITEAQAPEIVRFADTLRPRWKDSTVDAAIKSIRAYYKWLAQQGVIQRNPAADIRTLTPRTQPPRFVEVDDIRKMLEAASSDRDRALIALLTFGSLRVNELTNCDISDLEFQHGRYVLHFKPSGHARRRLPFVVLTAEIAQLVRRQLNGRRHGPLFLGNASGARLSRQGASTVVRRTAERARLPYPVSGQMLAYSLPAIALQRGFSYRGVVRAIGIPDRRHSERWLGAATDPTEDNAAIRLARLVMDPPDTSGSLLAHIEALANESDLPDAFAVMAAGAVVERHLRLLGSEYGIRAKEDAAKGSITYYVGELQRKGIVSVSDARKLRALGDLRNEAAHGWFERIASGTAMQTLRDARTLIERYRLSTVAAPGGGADF